MQHHLRTHSDGSGEPERDSPPGAELIFNFPASITGRNNVLLKQPEKTKIVLKKKKQKNLVKYRSNAIIGTAQIK